MKHCSACGSQLTEGAVFCAQCGFPVGPAEIEAETVEVAPDPPEQNLSFQEKPPPIRPPSPMRQFSLGLGITLAVITFLPLDRLFEVENEPAQVSQPVEDAPLEPPPKAEETMPNRTQAMPQGRPEPKANEPTPKAPLKLPQDLKIPTPEEVFKNLGKEADRPKPNTTKMQGNAAPPPSPATRRQPPAPTRLSLRRGAERLLKTAKRMEAMVAQGRTDDCDTLRSRGWVWVQGLRYNASRYESVGFLSSAANLLEQCVACDEAAPQACGEVERLLELEAESHNGEASP